MVPQILFRFRVLSLLFGICTFPMLFSYLSLNYFLLFSYFFNLTFFLLFKTFFLHFSCFFLTFFYIFSDVFSYFFSYFFLTFPYFFIFYFSYCFLLLFIVSYPSLLLTQSQGLLFSGELRETNRTIT